MTGKDARRPQPKTKPAPFDPEELGRLAEVARYVGSAKHVSGHCAWKDPGRAGQGALTVTEARADPPQGDYTMLCPEKWNRRLPKAATCLLRAALRAGHVSPKSDKRFPKYAYVRDPEDATIVYRAHLMDDAKGAYKAYPLTDAQILDLDINLP